MVDYTGNGALLLLMLALVARPLSRFYAAPLQYRRAIGVASFILALAHTGHMLDHSLNWNVNAAPSRSLLCYPNINLVLLMVFWHCH